MNDVMQYRMVGKHDPSDFHVITQFVPEPLTVIFFVCCGENKALMSSRSVLKNDDMHFELQ